MLLSRLTPQPRTAPCHPHTHPSVETVDPPWPSYTAKKDTSGCPATVSAIECASCECAGEGWREPLSPRCTTANYCHHVTDATATFPGFNGNVQQTHMYTSHSIYQPQNASTYTTDTAAHTTFTYSHLHLHPPSLHGRQPRCPPMSLCALCMLVCDRLVQIRPHGAPQPVRQM